MWSPVGGGFDFDLAVVIQSLREGEVQAHAASRIESQGRRSARAAGAIRIVRGRHGDDSPLAPSRALGPDS